MEFVTGVLFGFLIGAFTFHNGSSGWLILFGGMVVFAMLMRFSGGGRRRGGWF